MKSYQQASIGGLEKNVNIYCTHQDTLHNLMKELKLINPESIIESQERDLSGELCSITIRFKSTDLAWQARYWFNKQFMKQGWEPIGDDQYKFEIETTL